MVEHEWESEAENWIRWASTPHHDAYWFYRQAFFNDVLPSAGRRTLEIGCGEGRVTRDLAARGHRVVAVDISPTLLHHAAAADSRAAFALADGAALPFSSASFDVVVSYNSLQVVGDMAATVSEAARVTTVGGTFAICVTHPMSDVGHFQGDEPDAPYVTRLNYFENEWVDDTVERDGLQMRFTGWTHSLQDYSLALEAGGLQITALREPRPSPETGRYERNQRVPMFLLIRAVKRP